MLLMNKYTNIILNVDGLKFKYIYIKEQKKRQHLSYIVDYKL